jgi:predicted kinase
VYVLVSGLPGSGKSTLAAALGARLGWPVLAKDEIKESLWDSLGPGDREYSSRLGGAAQELLVQLAASMSHVVLDTFVHRDWSHRLASLPDRVVEVHCSCATDIARARYAQRRRHPCHFDTELLADTWDRWVRDDAEPLGLGPVLSVDTGMPVDVDAVVSWVRSS